MNNWEHYFEEKILDRGYFITDDVEILKRNSSEVKAIVSGTYDYDVEISFDINGNIESMHCTCPYFHTDYCKHLAALLYCLEEDESEKEEEDDIEELFNTVDDKSLKEFLLNELHSNWDLRNQFRLKFTKSVDENYYKKRLDDIIYKEDFSYDLTNFINNEIGFLFDKKEYALILELIDDAFSSVCCELNDYPWIDSYYDNLDEISEVLTKLTDTSVSGDVFDWLIFEVKYKFDEDYMDKFASILFDNFNLKYQLEEKYELIDHILSKISSFSKEKYILYKIQLMEDLNYPDNEIDKFRLKYCQYPKVQQQLISQAINDEDYDKAIELLKKAILTSEYGKHDFQIQLKDLYLKTGDMANYRKELTNLIIEYHEIDDYKELKKQYNKKEWEEIKECLYNSCIDDNYFLNQCFAYEKLYGRLIDNIHDEYQLSDYRKILSKNYSDELLIKYSKIVNWKVSTSGSRKHYRRIAELLEEMLKIPGGEDKVSKILDDWKIKYKNRPAMWDEIKNVIKC